MTPTVATETEITFADAAEMTIADLREGDYVIVIPTQMGIRGVVANSGIKAITEPSYGTWRIRRMPVASRQIRFMSGSGETYDYPGDCTVTARCRIVG
jgi:hypothetical protein